LIQHFALRAGCSQARDVFRILADNLWRFARRYTNVESFKSYICTVHCRTALKCDDFIGESRPAPIVVMDVLELVHRWEVTRVTSVRLGDSGGSIHTIKDDVLQGNVLCEAGPGAAAGRGDAVD